MPGRGIDRSAVSAYARDIANLGQCVEVIDTDVAGRARASDIKIAAVRVGSDVIESAIASDELNFEDLVRAAVLCVGEACKWKHKGECCNDERLA